ncbi:MAG: RNA polymerase subunit sigma, partial [Ignavibacteria bacterium]|nr:RNA polymerase subunit sigma [Ignavibacteria bacterium]
MSFHDAQKFLMQQDGALETARDHEKVILWFEHDLFDQSILIFLLYRLAQSSVDKSRIHLLSINHFEGIERFTGLGMLSAEQLESLYGSEEVVSPAQWKEAERAWSAFSSPDPISLLEFLHDSTDALPFLRAALVRHLREFPSLENGLNATEHLTLEILFRHSAPPQQLFREVTESEEHPWLGDTMFWPFLRRMATGKHPLLSQSR